MYACVTVCVCLCDICEIYKNYLYEVKKSLYMRIYRISLHNNSVLWLLCVARHIEYKQHGRFNRRPAILSRTLDFTNIQHIRLY